MTADTLGQRFRAWRRKHHYTLRGIDKRTGISASTLSQIEHGGTATHEHMTAIEALIGAAPPPPDDWRAVASALDAENAKLARRVLDLEAQLADERAVCGWFEAAAFQAGDEARALRDVLRVLVQDIAPLYYDERTSAWHCPHCEYCELGEQGGRSGHDTDCPVMAARALLERAPC